MNELNGEVTRLSTENQIGGEAAINEAAKNVSRVAEDLRINIGDSEMSLFARGADIAREKNVSNKSKDILSRFVDRSRIAIQKRMKALGINADNLIYRPGEVVSRMFDIDAQTASQMLGFFGIRVNTLNVVPEDVGFVLNRNSVVSEVIGAILQMSAQNDQGLDKPVVPSGKAKTKSANLPSHPVVIQPRTRQNKLVGFGIEMIPHELKQKDGSTRTIYLPKLIAKRKEVENEGIKFKLPKIEPPKINGKKLAGSVGFGTLVCMGGYFAWYIFAGGSEFIAKQVPPTPTPTTRPTPTPESFGASILRLTLPYYEQGLTSINFMDIKDSTTINMTAYAVDGSYRPGTWMWSRKTSDSLDYYKKILRDNSITTKDIDSFRRDPNVFINWLRQSGYTEQADFYAYRLGNGIQSPSGDDFKKWATEKAKPQPTPTVKPTPTRTSQNIRFNEGRFYTSRMVNKRGRIG